MTMPHWQSVKQRMIGNLDRLLVERGMTQQAGWIGQYAQSLAAYKEVDFYGFQESGVAKLALVSYPVLLRLAGVSEDLVADQRRILVEELYATLSFEQCGCRVIAPTLALVQELMDTEATMPLSEILAPFPHMYVRLPHELGLTLPPAIGSSEVNRIDGFYVTWAPCGEKTKKARQEASQYGVWDAGHGVWGICASQAEHQLHQAQLIDASRVFGDYAVRFIVVAPGPQVKETHDYQIFYYNLHWDQKEGEQELAEAAYTYHISNRVEQSGLSREEPVARQLFHLAVNLFFYMSAPQYKHDCQHTDNPRRKLLESELKKPRCRRNEKLLHKLQQETSVELYKVGQEVEVLGRREPITPADRVDLLSQSHGSPRTHWRRAHWRRQWCKRDGAPVQEWRRIAVVLVHGHGPAPASSTHTVR